MLSKFDCATNTPSDALSRNFLLVLSSTIDEIGGSCCCFRLSHSCSACAYLFFKISTCLSTNCVRSNAICSSEKTIHGCKNNPINKIKKIILLICHRRCIKWRLVFNKIQYNQSGKTQEK